MMTRGLASSDEFPLAPCLFVGAYLLFVIGGLLCR
jgi:hypothetical protein